MMASSATRTSCSTRGRLAHDLSADASSEYARFAELSNKGAKELGFASRRDVAVDYDMTPEEFATELERIWTVRPLYVALHTYVGKARGEVRRRSSGRWLIPAHLLGNMWAQEWGEHLRAGASAEHAIPATTLTEFSKRERSTR